MNKKSRFNYLFFIFLFLVLSIGFISSQSDCFPDDADYLCTDSFWSGEYLYCDIDDVVLCDYGCIITGTSNDYCSGSTEPPTTPPDLSQTAYISTPLTKYPNNPLTSMLPTDYACSYNEPYYTDGSTVYNSGTLHHIYRVCQGTESYMKYTNSTNGINWTTPINITGPDGINDGLRGYDGSQIKKLNGVYYMFLNKNSNRDFYIMTSTNLLNWSWACTSSPVLSGTYWNPDIFSNNYGYEGLISTYSSGTWYLRYINSSSLCSGWTDYGISVENAEGSSAVYVNGTWIVYYAEMWANDSAWWVVSISSGPTLRNLTQLHKGILVGNQTEWEGSGSGTITAGASIVEITDGNPHFISKFFIYYGGNQNVTGVAYDHLNRTFAEFHNLSGGGFEGSVINVTNSTFKQYENVTLYSGETYTYNWDTDFNKISGFVLDNYSYGWIWLKDNSGCEGWSSSYTLLTYPLDESGLTSSCNWGYNWSGDQNTITFIAGSSDTSFTMRVYGCEVNGEGYNCIQKIINFTVSGSGALISGAGVSAISNAISNIYPDSDDLTTTQKFSYILLTFLVIDLLIFFIMIFTKSVKFSGYVILILDLILFFFFIGVGYIPVGFLIIGILILLAIAFLKVKGGG